MAKGWTLLNPARTTSTLTTREKNAASRKFDNAIRNTKKGTEKILKEASENAYAKKVAQDDFLLAGFEDKRLKSKNLIKQAKQLKKDREAAVEEKLEKVS